MKNTGIRAEDKISENNKRAVKYSLLLSLISLLIYLADVAYFKGLL